MTRTILSSNRQINTLETKEGFFVLANAPRRFSWFPKDDVCELAPAVSGPFPLNDPRFSTPN